MKLIVKVRKVLVKQGHAKDLPSAHIAFFLALCHHTIDSAGNDKYIAAQLDKVMPQMLKRNIYKDGTDPKNYTINQMQLLTDSMRDVVIEINEGLDAKTKQFSGPGGAIPALIEKLGTQDSVTGVQACAEELQVVAGQIASSLAAASKGLQRLDDTLVNAVVEMEGDQV